MTRHWIEAMRIRTLPVRFQERNRQESGAVGTVVAGIFFFHEPVTFWRMLFTFTLIGSIVG